MRATRLGGGMQVKSLKSLGEGFFVYVFSFACGSL
jgi:hypothetical protein